MNCKKCDKEFIPIPNFRNYCSPRCKIKKPVAGWNKGIRGSTGDHRGEKNSYHRMTTEQKTNLAKLGSIAANKKIGENPELYAEKKRRKMNKLIDAGYKPHGSPLRNRPSADIVLTEGTIKHLNTILGIT